MSGTQVRTSSRPGKYGESDDLSCPDERKPPARMTPLPPTEDELSGRAFTDEDNCGMVKEALSRQVTERSVDTFARLVYDEEGPRTSVAQAQTGGGIQSKAMDSVARMPGRNVEQRERDTPEFYPEDTGSPQARGAVEEVKDDIVDEPRLSSSQVDDIEKGAFAGTAEYVAQVPEGPQLFSASAEPPDPEKGDLVSCASSVTRVASGSGTRQRARAETEPGAVMVRGLSRHPRPPWPPESQRSVDTPISLDTHHSSNNSGRPSTQSLQENSETPVLTATPVEEDPLVTAVAMNKIERRRRIVGIGMTVAALAAIVGLAVGLTRDKDSGGAESPTSGPTEPQRPALETVLENGMLRCGVSDRLGFSQLDEASGMREGFEMDLCRAVAAAVLGNSSLVEPVVITTGEKFSKLVSGEVDLVARTTSHTMERDVYEKNAGTGFSFTVPYLYDGARFGGVPFNVDCADLWRATGICGNTTVCLNEDTTDFDVISSRLGSQSVVPLSSDTLGESLADGTCNVIVGEEFKISEAVVRNAGYTGEYKIGTTVISRDPNAMVTRDGDPQWADFVNWVLQALLEAESRGITQATASDFPSTTLFGEQFEDMFINAITAVGNYGEMYNRHLEAIAPRQPLNFINENGDTGLIYSHPFGPLSVEGPGPGGTLEQIRSRGQLLCGILPSRPGFGVFNQSSDEWIGLDADYCRAVSAGIFGGAVDRVEFVLVNETGFKSLAYGDLDVLSGSPVSLETDVLEPTSGEGFSFSQPYFYDTTSSSQDYPLALATRQDDDQFSAMVYWIVTSTFYAEEKNYTRIEANSMPAPVLLFGSGYTRLFRDVLQGVGNYGELYKRNLESLIPRSGFNLLNTEPFGSQHYPLPFK